MRRFFEFGRFRLDAESGRLLRDGEVVLLPPKAAETLIVLVAGAGRPLERETLMQAIWGETIVEDANLTVAISQARKALGEGSDYIRTIPRVGYQFMADVHELILEKHTVEETVIE